MPTVIQQWRTNCCGKFINITFCPCQSWTPFKDKLNDFYSHLHSSASTQRNDRIRDTTTALYTYLIMPKWILYRFECHSDNKSLLASPASIWIFNNRDIKWHFMGWNMCWFDLDYILFNICLCFFLSMARISFVIASLIHVMCFSDINF